MLGYIELAVVVAICFTIAYIAELLIKAWSKKDGRGDFNGRGH